MNHVGVRRWLYGNASDTAGHDFWRRLRMAHASDLRHTLELDPEEAW
jgi:hypothetical protein